LILIFETEDFDQILYSKILKMRIKPMLNPYQKGNDNTYE